MKCPRCGSEMNLDSHRKYNLEMCYNCGYMEGRTYGEDSAVNNYDHLKSLNMNEVAAYIATALGKPESEVLRSLTPDIYKKLITLPLVDAAELVADDMKVDSKKVLNWLMASRH